MELYLIISLFFIYLITSALIESNLVKRIWTTAFIAAFICTSLALILLRVTHQDVMMQADTFNWYYMMYISGSITAVLGIVNLWIYRQPLWHLFFSEQSSENNKE